MKAQKREEVARVTDGSTVVGVFEDRTQVDRAVADLHSAGFRDDQIGVAMRHDSDDFDLGDDPDEGSEAGAGAASGALAGLGLGALAGMGVLAGVIPVIGPAIAGGTLGIILSNAAAGAGIAGLIGALVGAGIPEHEAAFYQNEFEAGRVVVTVQAAARTKEAKAILGRYGAYDASSRGNTGSSMSMNMQTPAYGSIAEAGEVETAEHRNTDLGNTIEVKEEQLSTRTHPVKKGEVRVRKEVRTENKTVEVPVEREEVVIERKPVHRNAASDDLRGGEEIRIPVREEEVEVTKSPVVTEEIKVGKRTVQDTQRVSGQIRKEQVQIDREGDIDIPSSGNAKGKKTT